MNVNDDAAILRNTRREQLPDGSGVKLLLPGDLTPSGKPIVAIVKTENAGVLVEWCSTVRGVFTNEREDSEKPAKGGPPPARAAADRGEDEDVRQRGGSGVAAEETGPTTEEEMERFLSQSLDRCQKEIRAGEEQRRLIEERLESLYVQAFRLKNAYKAYTANAARVDDDEECSEEASTPEVHNPVGAALPGDTTGRGEGVSNQEDE